MRALLLVFVMLVATAAPPAAASRQPSLKEVDLVSGDALPFAPHDAVVTVPTLEQTLALDAEMQAFIEPVKSLRAPRERMHALMRAMEERGMFSLEYAEVTRTASSTFHDRQGNCLSFTMLFVTLARAVGLQASFQSVEVPPSWSNDGKVVVATHVNTVVRTASGQETVVDFNIRPYEGQQRKRKVNDAYALGLFYSNLGAEALLRDEYGASLVYLREAAAVRPDIAGVWVNLGVLYARHGRYEHAEAAYLRALEVDHDEPSAMSNLVVVYEALGERALAPEDRARARSYRARTPDYLLAAAP